MGTFPLTSQSNPLLPLSLKDSIVHFAQQLSQDTVKLAETMMNVSKEEQEKPFIERSMTFAVISGPGYVHKIVALHDSIVKYTTDFSLIVCCINHETKKIFDHLDLVNVYPVDVAEIETFEPKLLEAKADRQLNEYCWTLKAPLCEWVLTTFQTQSVLYMDGDLFFFSSPQHIFHEWGQASIYVTRQRDIGWVEEAYGLFQAGMIGFKNDEEGLRSVRWWKRKCIEWCYKRSEEGKFGDQKYLDRIPQIANDVYISTHVGINAAPWNTIYHHQPKVDIVDGQTKVNDQPLVAFHFACLSITDDHQFDLWELDTLTIPKKYMKMIYLPYLKNLHKHTMKIIKLFPGLEKVLISKDRSGKEKSYFYLSDFSEKVQSIERFFPLATVVSKTYIVKALTMIASLEKTNTSYHLYVLAVDTESEEIIQKYGNQNVTIIPLQRVLTEQLAKVQQDRTTQEFCWTLKGPIIQYVLKTFKEIDRVIYVDADQYFFQEPTSLSTEWGTYSILLTRQRASGELERTHGRFQAGMIGFKREDNSLKILDWWIKKCLKRCSNEYDALLDSWGDQKYLDTIPDIFENIKIMETEAVNVGPWNLLLHDEVVLTSSESEAPHVNGKLIESYHFGSLSQISDGYYDIWHHDKVTLTVPQKRTLYLPYLQQMQEIETEINRDYGYNKTYELIDGYTGEITNPFYYSWNDEE